MDISLLLSNLHDRVLAIFGVVYTLALPILLLYLVIPSDSLLMRSNGGWPLIIYLWFTLLGFFVVSGEQLQERIRQMRWISLSAGLALVAGFCIIYSQIANPDVVTPGLLVAGVMRAFGGWICVLAIFGLGTQYLTKRTPRLEYANQAVLPFYILHQTVLLAAGYFVLQWGLPEVLEWATVVVISFAVIMALYEYLIRRWNVLRFLFGMKSLQPRPAEGAIKPQFGDAARARSTAGK